MHNPNLAKLVLEVCHDVQVEPHRQPLRGELLHHKSTKHKDDHDAIGSILELPAFGVVTIITLF